ncbi:PAS domain S-box protein [Microvirga sp. STR05]|uniref:histidine kinase n=1 Tax=Hymenobacter duratus TaxID=2771356 RepID=A0ABR8JH72_9BACT|nr:PAS domain S-box protein [Hymenobacter duratus]MBD2716194.1 PAS domain S-box protein [Hymenobacter duratus]MBR7951108.1 PAS domain S-box protein [Microvirga sp. STR05]
MDDKAADFRSSLNPSVLQELRNRAEECRRLAVQCVGHKTPDGELRLAQELHQIERKMQAEELKLAQREAEYLRAQYDDLYDFAPVGYCTLRPDGTITQLNRRCSQLLSALHQHLLGRRFGAFMPMAERPRFADFLIRVFNSGQQETCELEIRCANNTRFFAQCIGQAMELPEGQPPTHCRVALLDITERRQVAELATSESRFRTLFEQSADAVLLVRNRHIVDCNRAAMQLAGARHKKDLVGQGLQFNVPERQPDGRRSQLLIEEYEALVKANGAHRFEWYRYNMQGQPMWLEITLTNVALGGEHLIHAVWRDITEMRAAREQLRAEKEFSESLLDNSIDGIVALDREGRITAWNREAEHYSGIPEAAVLSRSIYSIFPRFDTPDARSVFRQVLQGERIMQSGLPFVNRPGQFDAYLVPLRSNCEESISGVLAVIRDVTERNRLLEDATRLKLNQQQEVLSAILKTQEAERKRIAEALHNGVGQLLYATKLHLERANASNQRDKSLSLLDEAIKMTRSISFELTPGILEDFGLKYALEELIRRIPSSCMRAHMNLEGLDEPLPELLELAVYRMLQELFNNIIKHAQAQEVFVHVVREGNQLSISVEDNGQGFDVAQSSTHLHGIGLPGIRNRVGLLGGTLSIDSRPGQGTIVSIELPVK